MRVASPEDTSGSRRLVSAVISLYWSVLAISNFTVSDDNVPSAVTASTLHVQRWPGAKPSLGAVQLAAAEVYVPAALPGPSRCTRYSSTSSMGDQVKVRALGATKVNRGQSGTGF